MNNNNSSADIITQDQFNQYTESWLNVVNDPSGEQLAEAFQSNGERLQYLDLPILRVMSLVSTVGVQQIKVRFMLVPSEGDGKLHFSLALFGTDADGARLSANYVPDAYWAATTPAPTAELTDPVPQDLAGLWIANWEAAPSVTPALFATSSGSLQGYNFGIKDFVTPLFGAEFSESLQLRIHFGLHEYYAPTDSPVSTFGLALRLSGPTVPAGGIYYDMATPCPPSI